MQLHEETLARITFSWIWSQSSRLSRLLGKRAANSRNRVFGYFHGKEVRGRALVAYTTAPFFLPSTALDTQAHTNRWQAVEIADILNRLGFVVDVISVSDCDFFPEQQYDLLLGHEPAFPIIARRMGKETTKVYYSCGMPWQFQNAAVNDRYDALRLRRGIDLSRKQWLFEPNDGVLTADHVLYLGNANTLEVHKRFGADISRFSYIANGLALVPEWPMAKDFDATSKAFLYLGSSDPVLRGLDRVLEAFASVPEYHLYVCSPFKTHLRFCYHYRKYLFGLTNIHSIGWISVHSSVFRSIVERCSFQIYPSASEGCSGSVLTCMGVGLIPIVSINCGIDVDDCGILLKDCDISTIRDTVVAAARIPANDCERMSKRAHAMVKEHYNKESFRTSMYTALSKIFGTRKSVER